MTLCDREQRLWESVVECAEEGVEVMLAHCIARVRGRGLCVEEKRNELSLRGRCGGRISPYSGFAERRELFVDERKRWCAAGASVITKDGI